MIEEPRIIVALDLPTREEALKLVEKLDPKLCRLKVANTMFTRYGPAFVQELMSYGYSIFLDLKYHDIPHQVAGACRSAAELGVWMVNLHVSGGVRMMQAAAEALSDFPKSQRPLLIGVTILTSMEENDLKPLGIGQNIPALVADLAKTAEQSGLDGIVCSAQEVSALRQHLRDDFLFVTPGIRLTSDCTDDQKRVMTPADALAVGSSYLVVGRPITMADDPALALARLYD